MAARHHEAPPEVLSEDDKAQAEITEAACAAVVEALRPLVVEDPTRLLRTLKKDEVLKIAVAVVTAYVNKRAAVEADMKRRLLDDPVDDLFV